jgi:hypothetical protein
MDRIIGAHSVSYCIGKDCAQQTHGSGGGAPATTDARQPVRPGFRLAGCFPGGNIEHECFDITASDTGDCPPPN